MSDSDNKEHEKIPLYIAHLEVLSEGVPDEFPSELSYVQFALNHHASIIKNIVEAIQQGAQPYDLLQLIDLIMHDEIIKENLKKITLEAMNKDFSGFHEVDGKSQAAFSNENVVDFPGAARDGNGGGTIH